MLCPSYKYQHNIESCCTNSSSKSLHKTIFLGEKNRLISFFHMYMTLPYFCIINLRRGHHVFLGFWYRWGYRSLSWELYGNGCFFCYIISFLSIQQCKMIKDSINPQKSSNKQPANAQNSKAEQKNLCCKRFASHSWSVWALWDYTQ